MFLMPYLGGPCHKRCKSNLSTGTLQRDEKSSHPTPHAGVYIVLNCVVAAEQFYEILAIGGMGMCKLPASATETTIVIHSFSARI